MGHGLSNDFKVLQLVHPPDLKRDTGLSPFVLRAVRRTQSGPVGLKNAARQLLGRTIQDGEHDSVEDATAALDIYKLFEKDWEQEIKCPGLTLAFVSESGPIFPDSTEKQEKKSDTYSCCSIS